MSRDNRTISGEKEDSVPHFFTPLNRPTTGIFPHDPPHHQDIRRVVFHIVKIAVFTGNCLRSVGDQRGKFVRMPAREALYYWEITADISAGLRVLPDRKYTSRPPSVRRKIPTLAAGMIFQAKILQKIFRRSR
jgi:hypothetical protein